VGMRATLFSMQNLDPADIKMKLTNFYEVADRKGDTAWGGASESEAVEWFRRGLDNTISVSVWNEEDIEEPKLVIDKIDITKLVLTTIVSERGRG
jgi:hypothetical protein